MRTRITNPNSLTVHAIAGSYVVLLGLDLPKANPADCWASPSNAGTQSSGSATGCEG